MNNKIFDYMTDLICCLIAKHDIPYNQACVLVSDVDWYIQTGRASTDWIKHLLAKRPCYVARRIAKGGSTNEIVGRVTEYIYGRETKGND